PKSCSLRGNLMGRRSTDLHTKAGTVQEHPLSVQNVLAQEDVGFALTESNTRKDRRTVMKRNGYEIDREFEELTAKALKDGAPVRNETEGGDRGVRYDRAVCRGIHLCW